MVAKTSVVQCAITAIMHLNFAFSNSQYKLCLLIKFNLGAQGCLLPAFHCKGQKGQLCINVLLLLKYRTRLSTDWYIIYMKLFIFIVFFKKLIPL